MKTKKYNLISVEVTEEQYRVIQEIPGFLDDFRKHLDDYIAQKLEDADVK